MRAERSASLTLWLYAAVLVAGVVALGAGLPADTFVAGDSGVKLIGVRHALRHPDRPPELPMPTVAGEDVSFVEPFFAPHGGHLHTVTSEPFVLATAPLVALFGLRGSYVLPGLGFLAAVLGWAWAGWLLDGRRDRRLLIAVAALGTPWLFYGLEFWEHAPALGATAVGTALLLSCGGGPHDTSSAHHSSVRSRSGLRALAAGACFGAAMLLRPEVIWFVGALVPALLLLGDGRPRWSYTAVSVGMAAATLLALAAFNLVHYGQLLDAHLTANAGVLGPGYVQSRLDLVRAWFIQPSDGNAWRVAPAVLLSAYAPGLSPGWGKGRAFLFSVFAVMTSLVLLTSPNDGGGHWAPRYLLCAYGPLSILSADVLHALGRRGIVGVALAVTVLAGSAWVQRASYRKLQTTKRIYGRMLTFVREQSPPGAYVITDLWWLDQVAAAAADERTFLYVPTATEARDLFDRLRQGRVDRATVVLSRREPSGALAVGGIGCYEMTSRGEITERQLVAIQLRRACPD